MQMKGMPQAVEILTEKIRDREKIRVIGDYDCDGINATYILLEGLESLAQRWTATSRIVSKTDMD